MVAPHINFPFMLKLPEPICEPQDSSKIAAASPSVLESSGVLTCFTETTLTIQF